MGLSVFRNPVALLLFRLWWLFAAAWLMLRLLRVPALHPLFWAVLALGCAAAGAVAACAVRNALASGRAARERRKRGRRFLCPHCLRFGPFRHACGGCEEPLESDLVYTRGAFAHDCGRCRAEVFTPAGEPAAGYEAWCRYCRKPSESDVYHHRRVRVLLTLAEADREALCARLPGCPRKAAREFRCVDDRETLTFVLNADALPESPRWLPRGHAALRPDALWLEGTPDPLALGRALDRLARGAGLSERGRRELPVLVAEAEWPEAARRTLESRFHDVRYGAGPADLPPVGGYIPGAVAAAAAELESDPPAPGVEDPAGEAAVVRR